MSRILNYDTETILVVRDVNNINFYSKAELTVKGVGNNVILISGTTTVEQLDYNEITEPDLTSLNEYVETIQGYIDQYVPPTPETPTIFEMVIAWGMITGTLSNQTDLQNALNNKQTITALLTSFLSLVTSADKIPYFTGLNTVSQTNFTSLARTMMALSNPSAIRFYKINADNTISLRTASEMLSDIGGQASGNYLVTTNNLSDVSNVVTARSNLGLVIGTNVQAYSSVLASLVTLGATAFGITSGTFAQGNDSRLSDARYTKMFVYENTTQSHTGNTTETIKINELIQGGSMGTNGILWIESQCSKSGGVIGTAQYRYYLGPTSGSLVGATLIGITQNTTTNQTLGFTRRMANKNSESLNEVYPVATTNAVDTTANSGAMTTLNIDTSTDLYLMVTIQLTITTETGAIRNFQAYINKSE